MSLPRSFIALFVLLATTTTAAAQQPAPVTVAPVEHKPINLASRLVATVEPMVRSTLAAEQAALVQERFFDEGQEVEKGALLAKFDDSLLLRRRTSSEAGLRSAQAELERARLMEANFRRERERITRLYEQSGANEKEYYDAINEHERAEASVLVEEANVAEREAMLEELKLQIEKTRVVAPFAGVVNRRYIEIGQWVKQGDPVAELVQLDPLYVRTGVPEAVLSRLKPGTTARFSVDALGGREFEGTVAEILPMADPESRTFAVRLRVENPDRLLLPGMFARATVVQQDESWLVVPKDAIVRARGQATVVLVDNGTARSVPVTLGAGDETSQAVRGEGLKVGDLVVTRGNEGLMDGTPLMVQNPPDGGGRPPGGGQGGPPGGQGGAGAGQGGPPGAGADAEKPQGNGQ